MAPQFSIDGGATWTPMTQTIKICYTGAGTDPDGEPLDLLVQVTPDQIKLALICPEGLAITYSDRSIDAVIGDLP